MLTIHGPCPDSRDRLRLGTPGEDGGFPDDAVWIDMLRPTPEEDRRVERHLGIEIPTREEMHDLEPSEIIYTENGARYMTARVICQSETIVPRLADVTFILTEKALVTVRYDEPGAFAIFLNRVTRPGGCGQQPEAVLDGLIETIVDRAAEVLRGVGDRIDVASRRVFAGRGQDVERGGVYQVVIQKIGQYEHIISNVRESMVSVERVLLFLSANYTRPKKAQTGFSAEWRSAVRDVQAIEEHATFLSNKLQFMLDATLGLVSIEQNKIIKLFSVVSVALMPPTLIASIYGMNFKTMPELDWQLGYPMAIGLMILFAVLPYLYFRWKKWL
ncbi:magnesium transporter CorA family protein [Bosea sp. (in: a-proteobacteria)]|uniref:magnesium transporter CorA family protein n=1 Tax=Bosea sp. (in: a-proteobacteria) TaxID=1871050 RepID=UPI0026093BE5|nr:magnesium transporter CorA family protein [Bosea sp. (in: a-proteobacteria)]MCO5092450.1 magnesium transporter CorA family protein [Bosea sp. (in: a-proteobacteria)]